MYSIVSLLFKIKTNDVAKVYLPNKSHKKNLDIGKILWELKLFADRFLEKCRAHEPAVSGSSNRRGRSSRFPGKLHTQHLCTACSLRRYELNPQAREDFLKKVFYVVSEKKGEVCSSKLGYIFSAALLIKPSTATRDRLL